MSQDESSAQAEIVSASKAGLVGKDELGLGANLEGFVPQPDGLAKILLGLAGFESEYKVDGSYVQVTPDDFMVVIDHRAADIVGIVWVALDEEERTFFSKSAGKEITFRPKRLVGWKPMGRGDSGVESALAEIGEIREGIAIQAMRALGGFARASADEGIEDEDLDYDEQEELRALMEEG